MSSTDPVHRLNKLALNLPPAGKGLLDRWLKQRTERSLASAIDLAAAAANVSLNIDSEGVKQTDPTLELAIFETLPTWEPGTAIDGAELLGAINTAKGRYFERLVVERLNDGEMVGGVILPAGYTAQLAPTMNNPGWDVQIVDQTGVTSEFLQLKATDNLGYLHGAIEQYPEMTFVATSEVASTHGVVDSGVTNEWLEEHTRSAFENPDSIDEVGGLIGGFGTLALIAARAGWCLKIGDMTPEEARSYVVQAGSQSLAVQSAAFAAAWLVGGWVAIPAVVASHWWMSKQTASERLASRVRSASDRLSHLRLFQQEQRLAIQ